MGPSAGGREGGGGTKMKGGGGEKSYTGKSLSMSGISLVYDWPMSCRSFSPPRPQPRGEG